MDILSLIIQNNGPTQSGCDAFWHLISRKLIEIRALSQLSICRPPPQFWSHFYERCAMCWIEWKIIYQILPIYTIALSQLTINKPLSFPPPSQFWSHFYERCAMCWNEWKNNFPIFIFRVIVIFVLKTVNFSWIFTITRKIKIGKLIFHSS